MVLGKRPVQGRSAYFDIVEQGPTALTISAGGGCIDIFSRLSFHSPFSLFLGNVAL